MENLPRPRALLLDLGGTILREDGFDFAAGHRRLFELAGAEPRPEDLRAYAARARALSDDIQPRRMESSIEFGTPRMTRLLALEFGLRFSQSDDELELAFWRAGMTMTPEPGITEALQAARARGLPLGVVSNTAFSSHVLCDELTRHGLLEPLSFVLASNDLGFRKPHPAIFQAAAARLSLGPEEIWFLGDSLAFDVEGAEAVGMTPIWYNPHREDAGGTSSAAQLNSWSGLEALLDASAG